MSARPLTAQYRHWLKEEMDLWREARLLSTENERAIWDLYEPPDATQARQQSWFIIALCGLAALLIGAAAMLVVGFNWDRILPSGKLAIVFAALLATYGFAGGCWRAGYPRLAEVVVFLGALFYGAAIWLIAQIFHMSAHYPDGYFWWALGVLPLALLFDTLLLHALFAVILSAWVGTEIIGHGHLGALLFGSRWGFLSNGAYLAPLLCIPGMWLAYKQNSPAKLTLYLLAIVFWTVLQPIAWQWYGGTAYFIGAVGTLLLILGESHFARSTLAIPYRVLGVMLFGGALLPLSYHYYYSWFENGVSQGTLLGLIIASLTGLTVAAAEFVRYQHLEQGRVKLANQLQDIRDRQWLPLSFAGVMIVLAFLPLLSLGAMREYDPGLGVISIFLANAAMVTLAIWLMWVGVRDNRGQPFAAGVGYFLLWMILRYVDLFGMATGMLGAAALFGVCGVSIGLLAWFWQRRKEVLHA